MQQQKCYIAIDLKSFYASQEAIARELDPMTVNLVVADESRTDKTVCLAVSPSLKKLGISGRARLFEAKQKVREANALRRAKAPGREFTGKSFDANELAADPSLEIDFIVAPPRMALYMECSSRIYEMYLKYVAPEDIHVYSIDEVFIDATPYLKTYHLTPVEFARKLIYEVLEATGITATAGIGTNMFLCKVAMDIVAKHIEADQYGVRIAELDEQSFKEKLWTHRPLTDFWRVGPGYARKLAKVGLHTMGDVARCSLGGHNDFHNEEMLYKLFGKNAELLIDHAWGYEPCTIAEIKAYRPETNCISSGQVLHQPYSFDKARIIVREMTELLVLDMVDKGLVTDQLSLTLGYDIENLTDPNIRKAYKGEITTDHYGRKVPKHAHGTANIHRQTSSTKLIMDAIMDLFDRIADRALLVRRVTLTAARVIPRSSVAGQKQVEQFSFFDDADDTKRKDEDAELEREHRRQKAVLSIQKKYGKNAILKGVNFMEGATTILSKAFKTAMKKKVLRDNPMEEVDRPKKNVYHATFYTVDEMLTLLEAFTEDPLDLPVQIAAYYGLRRSEVLGLKWNAIDFKRKTISIRHKVIEAEVDGKFIPVGEDVLKTKSSFRTLPLIPEIEQLLLQEKDKQETYRRLFKKSYCRDYLDYICVDQAGKLLRPNYVSEHFAWVIEKYDLKKIRFHDLRHTCASLLLSKGISMKQIQIWLGHSTFSTTADIYAHLDYSAQEESASAMSGMFTRSDAAEASA